MYFETFLASSLVLLDIWVEGALTIACVMSRQKRRKQSVSLVRPEEYFALCYQGFSLQFQILALLSTWFSQLWYRMNVLSWACLPQSVGEAQPFCVTGNNTSGWENSLDPLKAVSFSLFSSQHTSTAASPVISVVAVVCRWHHAHWIEWDESAYRLTIHRYGLRTTTQSLKLFRQWRWM